MLKHHETPWKLEIGKGRKGDGFAGFVNESCEGMMALPCHNVKSMMRSLKAIVIRRLSW